MKNPLTEIPGVGKSIAKDFNQIGIYSVTQLEKEDPEKLYEKMCEVQGIKLDRCVLYVMRCAVYYATTKDPKPVLLKWWNWKDRK